MLDNTWIICCHLQVQFYTDLGFRVKKQKGNKFVSVGDLSESLSHAEAKLGECGVWCLKMSERACQCVLYRSLPCPGQESYATVGSVALHALFVPDTPLSLLSVSLCAPLFD